MFDRYYSETTALFGLDNNFPTNFVLLSRPEEIEQQGVEFFICPVWLWTREATYQMQESARALATSDLPERDKERMLQEARHLHTASIRGRQFASSRSPKPI